MNCKSKGLFLAVALAAAFGFANTAKASPTMTLSVKYVGSALVSDYVDAANFDGTFDSVFSSGLSQYDLTAATTQANTGLVNMFEVYVKYTPNGTTNTADYFQGLTWHVNFGAGLVAAAPDGSAEYAASGTPLFFDNNTASFLSQNGPADGLNDLQGITTLALTNFTTVKANRFGTPSQKAGSLPAYDATVGGTPIGFFGMKFLGNLQAPASITAVDYGAGNASYYPGNGTTAPDALFDVNMAYNGITLPATGNPPPVDTPEPASLGVLALGGMALLARRRR
jgi:hypothetical protein